MKDGQSVGPGCPVGRRSQLCGCVQAEAAQTGREEGQAAGLCPVAAGADTVAEHEARSCIVSRCVGRRLGGWEGSDEVLRARGSAEEEQEPRTLQIGEARQLSKEGLLGFEAGLASARDEGRRADRSAERNEPALDFVQNKRFGFGKNAPKKHQVIHSSLPSPPAPWWPNRAPRKISLGESSPPR